MLMRLTCTDSLWLKYLERRERELADAQRRIELMEFALDILEAADRF